MCSLIHKNAPISVQTYNPDIQEELSKFRFGNCTGGSESIQVDQKSIILLVTFELNIKGITSRSNNIIISPIKKGASIPN